MRSGGGGASPTGPVSTAPPWLEASPTTYNIRLTRESRQSRCRIGYGGIYEFRNSAGEILRRFDQTGRGTLSGWQPSYMFHQPAMEHALRRRLAENPPVSTSTGHRFVGICESDEQGVTASIAAPGGYQYRVRARFLVGADGGASLVRQTAGMELFDYGFEEPWLVVDTTAADESGLPQHAVQVCDPKRPTTVMPMSPGRWRWVFMLLPGEQADEMLGDSCIAQLLATQVRPNQVEVIRKAVYRFHGLVAKKWRVGSVLLAGDSAHQMPPFMGQGMCSGLRDAANRRPSKRFIVHNVRL